MCGMVQCLLRPIGYDHGVAPGHEPESEALWREAWLAGLWAKEIARERRKHVECAFLAALAVSYALMRKKDYTITMSGRQMWWTAISTALATSLFLLRLNMLFT